MLSTAASLGMLMMWDVEMGLDKIDPYTTVEEDYVKVCTLF
jgi:26S proteasome regulatory subunit N1